MTTHPKREGEYDGATLPLFPHAHARRADPDTSHLAAAALDAPTLRDSQAAVLAFFYARGAMTDEELVARYDLAPVQSPSGLRSRRHELVVAGKLKDGGGRHRLASGRLAIIWTLDTDRRP